VVAGCLRREIRRRSLHADPGMCVGGGVQEANGDGQVNSNSKVKKRQAGGGQSEVENRWHLVPQSSTGGHASWVHWNLLHSC
jgi:hypothetical protein